MDLDKTLGPKYRNHELGCLKVQKNYEIKSFNNRKFFHRTFWNLDAVLNLVSLDLKATVTPTTS